MFSRRALLASAAASYVLGTRPWTTATADQQPPLPPSERFGTGPNGELVLRFSLKNANGAEIKIISYGATITSIVVPGRDGPGDVVLGYDTLQGYLDPKTPYFGAAIGRYANRIANGRFVLDGRSYDLARNNGPNHLHGGLRGFDKVNWTAHGHDIGRGVGVAFSYLSRDGEEGYPGELRAVVGYTLTDSNELVCDYLATTTKPTPINLTQHTYFNLSGPGISDILDHELMLNAERFTPIDATLIPTGELAPVAGTPFDFRKYKAIGKDIDASHDQIKFGLGYDHNFVLSPGAGPTLAARVKDPKSSRLLEVYTDQPGIQFYSGNFLDGSIVGKAGVVYNRRHGFCLETQHFPDSPNKPDFPPTILKPREFFRSQTTYKFSVATG